MNGRLKRALKTTIMDVGLYKPYRWGIDHVLKRRRLSSQLQLESFLKSFLVPGDLCFDVGANIGDYTAAMRAAGAKVIAVDPQPLALRELSCRHGGDPNVVIINAGVGNREGMQSFHLHDHHVRSSFVEEFDDKFMESISVRITTLDALISQYGRPAYIKIDVEGFELEVVRGLTEPVPLISFEYHITENSVQQTMAVIARLEELGGLTLNLIAEGQSGFYFSAFVSKQVFMQDFPVKVGPPNYTWYGDVFAKFD